MKLSFQLNKHPHQKKSCCSEEQPTFLPKINTIKTALHLMSQKEDDNFQKSFMSIIQTTLLAWTVPWKQQEQQTDHSWWVNGEKGERGTRLLVELTQILPVSIPRDSLLVSGLKDIQEHEAGDTGQTKTVNSLHVCPEVAKVLTFFT